MPRYPDPPNGARHDPLVVRAADESEAYTIYTAPTPHGAVDPYRTPPGMHLVAGPDGQPAYAPLPQPTRPGADPRLINAALIAVIALALCVGLWFAAAFLTALAALIKAGAIALGVGIGGVIVLKFLGTGRGGTTHIDVRARGRARVDINTRRTPGRRAARR
ncbi:hypothetical protein [Streptomyces platensis]|uniref:hypothetical protein n=1 Tax=Streptomyces platensis TaxID=58346 RepID=UPI00386B9864|nr:hypothetical protein OG962_37405 [Streptomyces platensis]